MSRSHEQSFKRVMVFGCKYMDAFYLFCSTLKQGCTAGIKLSLSDDRQCLKVTEVSEEHNHEISKVSLSVVSVYSVCACATRLSVYIYDIVYVHECMS